MLLFVAIVVIGALALGSAGRGGDQPAVTGAASLPVLTARTHTQLLLGHVGRSTVLDVDRGTLRDVDPGDVARERAARPAPVPLRVDAFPRGGDSYRLVANTARGPRLVTDDGLLLTAGPRLVLWRPYLCDRTCPMRVTDARTGGTRTVSRFDPRAVAKTVLSPDERTVAVFDGDGGHPRARLVDLRDPERTARFSLPLWASSFVWSRDSRWLFAAAGADLVAIGRDGTIGRVDVLLPPFEVLTPG